MDDLKSQLNELRTETTAYVNVRLEVLKLTIYEKSAKLTSAFASSMVMAFVGFFFILFVFLAAANWIGEMMNSLAAGYGIVALFYLVLLLVFMALRKNYFEKPIIDKVIEVLMEDENETESKS